MPRHSKKVGAYKKRHNTDDLKPYGRKRTRVKPIRAMPKDDMLRMLLADDYWPIVRYTLDRDPDLTDMISDYIGRNRSTYAPMGVAEAPMQYFQRHGLKIVTVVEILNGCGHQQKGLTPWKLMKTFSAMKQKMRRVQWETDVKDGKLLSATVVKKLLVRLKELQPPSTTVVSKGIAFNCSDQLLLFRGCRKRHSQRNTFERIDSEGNKVKVESNTILMMKDHVIDDHMFPITKAEIEHIKCNGPYTEHPDEIFKHLNWDKCQEHLCDTMDAHTQSLIEKYFDGDQSFDSNLLSPDHMLYLLVRPDYNPGGPTETTLLTPIPDCDTNNLKDMNKYCAFLEQEYQDQAVIIASQDAQGITSHSQFL